MSDVTTRRCSTCLKDLPEDQFGVRRTMKFPEGKVYKICAKCRAYKVGQVQRPRIVPPCEPGTRRCPQCSAIKPEEEFTGVRCTVCRNAYNSDRNQRFADDPEFRERKRKAVRDSRRRAGRPQRGDVLDATCVRCFVPFTYQLAGALQRTLCDLCVKHKQEGLKYGLTGAQVEEMRSRPTCEVCGTDDAGVRGFKIDHCHATNVVRGMLCHGCNVMLGIAKDQPDLLRAAANYVEKYRALATGVEYAVQ